MLVRVQRLVELGRRRDAEHTVRATMRAMREQLNGTTMRYATVVTVVMMLAAACRGTSESPAVTASPEAANEGAAAAASPSSRVPIQQTSTVRKRMQDHFDKSLEIKAAVEKGNIEAVKGAATWLAATEWTPRLRPDWRPYMIAMQLAATEARNATDVIAAARALSRVGRTCANCHEDVGGPAMDSAQPDVGPRPHAWAAERMWEGLIAPSASSWNKGAEVLFSADLRGVGADAQPRDAAKISRLESKVRELARIAITVDAQQRATVYAELVVTCSSCHEMTDVVLR
jgi:hypothetical protein